MNDRAEFERNCKEICSSDRELKKENIGYYEGPFFDLGIKNEHRKINIQLYNKRDDFPFSMIKTSHLTKNIPSKFFLF